MRVDDAGPPGGPAGQELDRERARVVDALRDLGLLAAGSEPRAMAPLSGGVSSAIWRVSLASGDVCVKWALPKLRVAADWYAPIERNASEVAWLELAGAVAPGSVPSVLASDPERGVFVMPFLGELPVWKSELRDGRVDIGVAAALGTLVAMIHGATADDATVAERFDTIDLFRALRIDPYLVTSASRNPDVADELRRLADELADARIALVHGDVSPKNVLVGPDGPVLLDAECAWYGDPAFDVAFCCCHLLLKCLWRPDRRAELLASYDAFVSAYLAGAGWEPRSSIEERVAALLPALLLARVDGSSPVEYLTAGRDKDRVRDFAIGQLLEPSGSLTAIAERWDGDA